MPDVLVKHSGTVVEVAFEAAATRRDVAHGLGAVPDGYEVLWATHVVTAPAWAKRDERIVPLHCATANGRCAVVFYTWQKVRRDARL